jgi:hypothetical protein|tara:strand:- start:480 stop:665 length:186 start_codon:yes stop_codon:yes gene_type:complete
MAEIKQNVVQFNLLSVPPRMIVQFTSDSGEETQNIIKYTELSDDEKATFDAFKELSVSKMT